MKKAFKSIDIFFDHLEDAIRGRLSKHPFIYGFIGGSGVILFWRGVWHTADWLQANTLWGGVVFSDVGSMLTGIIVLLMSGLFVSVFIGDSILISGLRHEKKVTEKTEDEVAGEKADIEVINEHIEDISAKLEKIRSMTCN
ncbi:MAG: hypothetical protein QG653_390 [Patescibacteria group bacterium]|nr:hypothetical protein [Patescibacteria group bacterium]